jgi:patatin-like phospholipase/acyl hydrolase
MSKAITILSIDGGGIRGIIPGLILAEIEKRTKKRIHELFDLIAGTSTGGILTLGLTKPDNNGKAAYTALDGVALYEKEGHKIFSAPLLQQLQSVGGTLEEKYPSQGIESVLDKYFGETTLREALTDIIIPSFEIEQGFPFFFKSKRATIQPEYDFPMKKVARATTAAPTYFEPLKLDTVNPGEFFALIDGGVFANNPAMCAYAEATHTHPKESTFFLVSIGTGQNKERIPYGKAKGWGALGWARPLLNLVFDGVNDTVDYQLNELLNDDDGNKWYYRLQPLLKDANRALDNTSPANINQLKQVAFDYINEHNADLEAVCTRLIALNKGKKK